MKTTTFILLIAFTTVEAATKIAVLEFGKGGSVRSAQGTNSETSVEGVVSFWSALHRRTSSKVQYAGMPVVPDLFSKPDSGIVIGVSGDGVDLHSLKGLSSVFEMDEIVGVLEVSGRHCKPLLDTIPDVVESSPEIMSKSLIDQAKKNSLSGVKVVVDKDNIKEFDQQIVSMFSDLSKVAQSTESTFIVHFLVEEDESVPRKRRLEDDQNANGENVEDDKEYNGYYGYAYLNKYGVWVTPYKTMFQIQYFNVVTWTAISLVLLLIFCIFLMAYMPLEADTLLFGESAKFVGDE